MKEKVIIVGDAGNQSDSARKTLRDSLLSLSATPIMPHPEPFIPSQKNKNAALALATLGMWGVIPELKKKTEKPLQKCGLKECNVMTIRDFCCAEHYRTAKAKHKT